MLSASTRAWPLASATRRLLFSPRQSDEPCLQSWTELVPDQEVRSSGQRIAHVGDEDHLRIFLDKSGYLA
jgi:hypothetical protein